MRLTIQQLLALVDLSEGKTISPHQVGLEVRTFRSLQKMGLADCHGGSGQDSIWGHHRNWPPPPIRGGAGWLN